MGKIKTRAEKKEFIKEQIGNIDNKIKNLEFQKRNLENKLFNLERMGDETNDNNQ